MANIETLRDNNQMFCIHFGNLMISRPVVTTSIKPFSVFFLISRPEPTISMFFRLKFYSVGSQTCRCKKKLLLIQGNLIKICVGDF